MNKPVTFLEALTMVAGYSLLIMLVAAMDNEKIIQAIEAEPQRIQIECPPLPTKPRSPAFIDDRICYMEVKK